MIPGGGGFTGDTVLNVMRRIRYAKYKKAKITENNLAARAVTKAADITKYMTLGKDAVEKLEAIEDKYKRVEVVGNLTKPRMTEILVMYVNTVRVQTSKETLRLDCIFTLNAPGVLKNGVVV